MYNVSLKTVRVSCNFELIASPSHGVTVHFPIRNRKEEGRAVFFVSSSSHHHLCRRFSVAFVVRRNFSFRIHGNGSRRQRRWNGRKEGSKKGKDDGGRRKMRRAEPTVIAWQHVPGKIQGWCSRHPTIRALFKGCRAISTHKSNSSSFLPYVLANASYMEHVEEKD